LKERQDKSPDETVVVTGDEFHRVIVYDILMGEPKHYMLQDSFEKNIVSVAYSPGGKYSASGG